LLGQERDVLRQGFKIPNSLHAADGAWAARGGLRSRRAGAGCAAPGA